MSTEEYFEKYREEHKDQIRAYGQKYYQEHKEQIKEKNRLWRKSHPEQYRAATRRHFEANQEKLRERSRQWYSENKQRAAQTNRRKKLLAYGLTQEQFTSMLEAQKGVCLICQNPMTEPVVDHDHSTGVVRGLLCRTCNAALGQFRESVEILGRAANYLRNSSSGAT